MLYGQIEKELAEIEPWLFGQETNILPLIEPECEIRDYYDEALLDQIESRINSSNHSGSRKITASSLYQLFFYYLSLLMGWGKIGTPLMQRGESSNDRRKVNVLPLGASGSNAKDFVKT